MRRGIKEIQKERVRITDDAAEQSTAQLKPEQFISRLFEKQNEPKFAEIFDNTLLEIAKETATFFQLLPKVAKKSYYSKTSANM